MDLDTDTFLTTVYCVVDDWYREHLAARRAPRPGAKGKLSDSEVLTLAALAQGHGHRCETCFLQYVRTHWLGYFPGLTCQSAFNRRVRQLWAALALLGPGLAHLVHQQVGQQPAYEVWDGVPIPLMRRCRGLRRKLFTEGEANFGTGGSDKEWYYGVHALVAVSPDGPITGWVAGAADLSEYWLAETLLRWRQDPRSAVPTTEEVALMVGPTHKKGGQRVGPAGPVGPRWAAGAPAASAYLGDLGFKGQAWRQHWQTDYTATVLTKADYEPIVAAEDRTAWRRWLSGLRQQAETAFSLLTDRLGAKFPRARGRWGLWTRLAAKVVAFNLAVYCNVLFGRPTYAFVNPIN
jgi:hypothetical protein